MNAQGMIPKLSEAEIKAAIPLIQKEITGYGQLIKLTEVEKDLRYALFLDIKSGKVDPLEWLKQRSKYVIVPPGAVYESACSRAASIKGWDLPDMQDPEVNAKPTAHPTAIFTFGKDMPAINKHLLGKNITDESYRRFVENPFNADDPSYEKIRTTLEQTRIFYSKNGFSTGYSMDGFSVYFYPLAAEKEISGIVLPIDVMLFDPFYPDVAKQCRSHPMGPSIEIRAGDKLIEQISQQAEKMVGKLDTSMERSLKKAGITEDRYALIKTALIIARRDSENPEEPEPTVDFTPTTPEEKETARIIEMMREDARAKKHNIMLYKKYKAELDPILEILQKYMGG